MSLVHSRTRWLSTSSPGGRRLGHSVSGSKWFWEGGEKGEVRQRRVRANEKESDIYRLFDWLAEIESQC